jgi:hypothetical protein
MQLHSFVDSCIRPSQDMLKAENKKILQIYLAAIAIFSVLVGVVPTGLMVAYASNDRNNNDNNNDRNNDSPQNRACYNAGLADGRKNNPYSQTMLNQCFMSKVR